MSDVLITSADWLARREPADARARSRELAFVLAAQLRPPLRVHDLGSGTGSMLRWLAPLLPGPQHWVLHDWNPELVQQALHGPRTLDSAGAAIEVESRAGELAQLTAGGLSGASLVTASALLDVLTAAELQSIVAACVGAGAPALFSLSVTGRVELTPIDDRDADVQDAFNAHQQRLAQDRRLVGPRAGGMVQGLFRGAGWQVRNVATPWRLDAADPELLHEWFDGWLGAALEQRPELDARLADYTATRRAQLDSGSLAAIVHHTDLVAWRA